MSCKDTWTAGTTTEREIKVPLEKLTDRLKHVTFPPEEEIVSGAYWPRNPGVNAHKASVDETIAFYMQSCEKHGAEPISTLVQQLQEISDAQRRVQCLNLKGVKLDAMVCETLEEILKQFQYEFIHLEEAELEEEGAAALFDMFTYYDSAFQLDISSNKNIGRRGWHALSNLIKQNTSLELLKASQIPLVENAALSMARALQFSKLIILYLENTGLSGRPLMLLVSALKINRKLKKLYLGDNDLNDLQDSMFLGELLQFNHTLELLDVKHNRISDDGMEDICKGLQQQQTAGLRSIVLWHNHITAKSMQHLATALIYARCLKSLNLGRNAIQNEGIHRLKEALICNRSLQNLGLVATKITCEGAVALAEFIVESPCIQHVDLRKNAIKTGGLMALSLALKISNSVIKLELDKKAVNEKEEDYFIDTQKALLLEIRNHSKQKSSVKRKVQRSQSSSLS
ncbi:protein phosphatase 1 regulatory subunit 37-like [Protopterus annectens]|uniref:protein phosphatase 1 regulatory subunit 37-like n=1 Tax=Protopterus annectens TaxID=7888 RepID=UPI001CFC37BE|nr:protein phosphatase 1 regulatory subunit 37-like [Protopterus annectens]